MKKITPFAVLALLGVSSMALAQEKLTVQQLDQAKRAIEDGEAAAAVVSASDADVEHINVRVDLKAVGGENARRPGSGRSESVVLKPTDPEFAAVLAAAKAAYARKAAKADTDYSNIGLSVAAPVAVPLKK